MTKKVERPPIWTSQNFIKREGLVAELLAQSEISKDDLVIEIGSGKGIITKQLAQKAKQVIGIESDQRLALALQSEFKSSSQVKIVAEDFLSYHLPSTLYKVFANIPFNLTADIIRKLTADFISAPTDAYLLMQKQAALRFMGKPQENQISILLQPFYQLEILRSISPLEFSPVPKVKIVLLHLTKKSPPDLKPAQTQNFRDFIIYGFNAWQPSIAKAYKDVFTPKQLHLIRRESHFLNKRPSKLSYQQWRHLFSLFQTLVTPEKKALITGAEMKWQENQKTMRKQYRTRLR